MSKEYVTIPRKEILGLISCAEDYGYTTLLPDFFKWLDSVSDEEIENYAKWFKSEEAQKKGYGEEDYETSKERLIEYRKKYQGAKT